ncbi:hypothetical protein UC8_36890 [Roseimaritima ulvae]|uniref:Uncharacterized protein n=1 Tax=Roseimaritima ulvae TaxID=980254 RepID=A0A5B9R5Y3_9BACT|nr:hypothetical protein UC8_36890 [Roseimaritima ulvae]
MAAAVLLASSSLPLQAQSPQQLGGLKPVPKFGEAASPAASSRRQTAPRQTAWNLHWRKSSHTEPAAAPQPIAVAENQAAPNQAAPNQAAPNQAAPNQTATNLPATSPAAVQPAAAVDASGGSVVAAALPSPRVPIRKLSPHSAPLTEPAIARTSYRQSRQSRQASSVQPANFQDPGEDSTLQLPPSLQLPGSGDENIDIFDEDKDPFQDDPLRTPQEGMQQPATPGDLSPPATNPMRDPASPYDRGEAPAQPDQDDSPAPAAGQPPAQDPDEYINPFQRPRGESMAPMREEETLPSPRSIQPTRVQDFSCDTFRERIAARTIEKISLDISPPFRPDILDADDLEQERRKFSEKQGIRDWRSMDGYVMARGRLQDLAYEKVLVESEHGTTEEIPLNRISEGDLAYISEQWGLPSECRIRQEDYTPRNWTPSQVAWKASGLCHKPLYFEEVNLERYGHTAGPVAQPVLSTAHFFVNIAVLPYKMGIHPPTECQYTLGYYRPGSCAPWVVPPVPISLRGAIAEAAVVGGFVGLIP